MNDVAKVKESGRLRYVEPTIPQNFKSANYQGTIDSSILFPYEDYNMAVDLIIETTNRYACGNAKWTNEETKIMFSSRNGTLSFLGGTDGTLTTNYTDIDMKNPDKNTQECLGIESINISYTSWFFPQVVIKFVDVRGATVMQPAEKAYYQKGNSTAMKNVSKLYQAFFTYPYPIFTLKVKGFYGKGVTYKLCCQKTSVELDGESGNFIITANFVGYMFGIYADMPMTLVSIAPFTEEGEKYWNNKIESGVFYFKDSNGNDQKSFITIPELKKKMLLAAQDPDVLNAAMGAQQVLESYNAMKEYYGRLSMAEEAFDDNNTKVFYSGSLAKEYNITVSRDPDFTEKLVQLEGIFDEQNMRGLIPDSDIAKLQETGDMLTDMIMGHTKDLFMISATRSKDGSLEMGSPHKELNQVLRLLKTNGEPDEKTGNRGKDIWNAIFYYIYGDSKQPGTKVGYGFLGDLRVVKPLIARKKDELQKNTEIKYKEYKKKENEAVERALGFKPSIQNIYNLVFAHMDTFIHCFYWYVDKIKDKLDNIDANNRRLRAKKTFGIKDGDSDTDNANEENPNALGNYLPPFTGFYKTRDIDNAKELVWPGSDKVKDGDTLDEVQFVYDILAASQIYGDEMKSADNVKNAITTRGNLATNPYDFIPLTPTDFVYGGDYGNPYKGLKQRIIKEDASVPGDIIFKFALRAFHFIYFITTKVYSQLDEESKDYSTDFRHWIKTVWSLMNASSTSRNTFEKIKKFAEMFGEVEALNFKKGVGMTSSFKLRQFVRKLADDEDEKRDGREFRKTIAPNSKSSTKGNKAWASVWDWGGNNTNKELFYETKDRVPKLQYNLWHEPKEMFFPTNTSKINVIKDDYAHGNLESNPSYLMPDADRSMTGDGLEFKYDVPMGRSSVIILSDGNYFLKFSDAVIEEYSEDGGEDENENKKEEKTKTPAETLRSHVIERYDQLLTDVVTNRGVDYASGVYVSEYTMPQIMTSDEARSKTLVRYPCGMFDEKEASYFGKYDDTGVSLHKLNYDNVYADAFLFLQCTLFVADEKVSKNYYLDLRDNVPILKAQLLREGSFYWRQDEMKLHDYKDPIKVPYGYANPFSNEGFNGDQNWDRQDTLTLIKENKYRSWEGTGNKERRAAVKAMFKSWAENSYKNIRDKLADSYYYISDSTYRDYRTPEYMGGLDLNLLSRSDSRGQDAREIQAFLQDCLLSTCMVYSFGFYEEIPKVNTELMVVAFRGFMDGLRRIYGVEVDEAKNSPMEAAKKDMLAAMSDPFRNNDIRLSLYMTLKSLYDKWLCAPYKGREMWQLTTDPNDEISDFSNFRYVDNFYNDIGRIFNVGLTDTVNWLESNLPTSQLYVQEHTMGYMGRSLLEFMTEIAQNCGAMLFALPQKFGLDNANVENMFKPISVNDTANWDDDSSSFIFMYTYKPSEHLGTSGEKNDLDMNGWSREGDGVDLTDDEVTGTLFAPATGNNQNYTIPAFGVTYAKQNQSIFKNIGLTTENNGVTEPALRATFDIASGEQQKGDRQTTFFGQDLYRVYSQYSYLCSIEMIGNMQIMPPMYFQLNNVPLWKGAYMVKKVTHNITAGNISTKVEGMRINKYAIPLADATMMFSNEILGENVPAGTVGGDTGGGATAASAPMVNSYGGTAPTTVSSDGAKLISPQPGNPSAKAPDVGIPDTAITASNPLFVFTPAHSTGDKKKEENAWSIALIDKYIIPKMKAKGLNAFRGNQNRPKSYDLSDARNLANKYGSEKIVSIVPHWNGCGSKYFISMYGLDGGKTYGINEKSPALTTCFAQAAEETKKKAASGGFPLMPDGAMNGEVKKTPDARKLSGRDGSDGNKPLNDPALMFTNVVPALALLENWFGDYVQKGYSSAKWLEYGDEMNNGKYIAMAGWLRSSEGSEAISDLIVKGCLNYIAWLGNNGSNANNSLTC